MVWTCCEYTKVLLTAHPKRIIYRAQVLRAFYLNKITCAPAICLGKNVYKQVSTL